jgi:hypothetical protein
MCRGGVEILGVLHQIVWQEIIGEKHGKPTSITLKVDNLASTPPLVLLPPLAPILPRIPPASPTASPQHYTVSIQRNVFLGIGEDCKE